MQRILIFKFSILFTSLLSANALFAQKADSTEILPDLTIQSDRLQLPFQEQVRTIQVLERTDLQAMPVHSVAEALQQIPGIDIRQRGPFGLQADIHVRGAGFDQALVLLNGVRLADPQTGHHIANIPVDWSAVERIEVLKGPGARIFGQNAFGSAINVVTRPPATNKLVVSGAAGDFGYGSGSVYGALVRGDFRQHLGISGDFSSGYRHNTDFSIVNGYYQAVWPCAGGAGLWNVQAGFTERKFGANGFYGRLEFTEQYEAVQTSVVSASYTQHTGKWQIRPRVSWRRNQDWYVFTRSNPSAFQNFHLSHVGEASFNATWNNTLGVGASTEYTVLHSTRLGERTRFTTNLYAEYRLKLFRNRFTVVPGLAVSNFSDFGLFVFPGVDFGFQVDEFWNVYANVGYNNRIPTFTDLYYEDAGSIGNPDLKPERAFSSELGARWARAGWMLQGALFQRQGIDLIDWTKGEAQERWTTRNFNRVTMQGLDVSLNYRLERGVFSAGYTFIDARVDSDAAFSRYTLNHLRHQLTGSVMARVYGPVNATIRTRWADRTGVAGDYWVTDAKLSVQLARLMFFAEATNIFDEQYGDIRYSESATLTLPGRWFRAGISWHILP